MLYLSFPGSSSAWSCWWSGWWGTRTPCPSHPSQRRHHGAGAGRGGVEHESTHTSDQSGTIHRQSLVWITKSQEETKNRTYQQTEVVRLRLPCLSPHKASRPPALRCENYVRRLNGCEIIPREASFLWKTDLPMLTKCCMPPTPRVCMIKRDFLRHVVSSITFAVRERADTSWALLLLAAATAIVASIVTCLVNLGQLRTSKIHVWKDSLLYNLYKEIYAMLSGCEKWNIPRKVRTVETGCQGFPKWSHILA